MLFPEQRCDKRLKPQIIISLLNRCISSEWIGRHCQEPRNPCQGSPCQNNGRCVQAISTDDQTFFSLGSADQRFSCLCEPDFGEFIFISMDIFYNVIGWLTIYALFLHCRRILLRVSYRRLCHTWCPLPQRRHVPRRHRQLHLRLPSAVCRVALRDPCSFPSGNVTKHHHIYTHDYGYHNGDHFVKHGHADHEYTNYHTGDQYGNNHAPQRYEIWHHFNGYIFASGGPIWKRYFGAVTNRGSSGCQSTRCRRRCRQCGTAHHAEWSTVFYFSASTLEQSGGNATTGR